MGNSNSNILPATYKSREKYLFVSYEEVEELYLLFWKYSSASCEEEVENPIVGMPIKEVRQNDPKIWQHEGNELKLLRIEQFLSMPCMKANPLAPRLFEVFKDKKLGMSWESFLLLASSMNLRAPSEVKSFIAYKVFDFNNNKDIEIKDISKSLQVMTGMADLWADAKKQAASNPPIDPSINSGWPNDQFPLRSTVFDSESGGLLKQCAMRLASGDRKKSEQRKSCMETWLPHMEETINKISDRAFVVVDTDFSQVVSRYEYERVCFYLLL